MMLLILEPFAKSIFGRDCCSEINVPMAALLVGEKWLVVTTSTLRFFTFLRLVLEQNLEFCKKL